MSFRAVHLCMPSVSSVITKSGLGGARCDVLDRKRDDIAARSRTIGGTTPSLRRCNRAADRDVLLGLRRADFSPTSVQLYGGRFVQMTRYSCRDGASRGKAAPTRRATHSDDGRLA